MDSRDVSVKAWIGSADYRNDSIDGQVNGVLAKRSPGSTLKPFVYALALDQGVLHPQTILRDTPTAFGPFTPENFDGRFFGPEFSPQMLCTGGRRRFAVAIMSAGRISPLQRPRFTNTTSPESPSACCVRTDTPERNMF